MATALTPNFIKLTHTTDTQPIYINLDHITYFVTDGRFSTIIYFHNEKFVVVDETAANIRSMIANGILDTGLTSTEGSSRC